MTSCTCQVRVLFHKTPFFTLRSEPVQQSAKDRLKSWVELGGTAHVLKVKWVPQSFAESMSKSV